jgi:hypothetical protein
MAKDEGRFRVDGNGWRSRVCGSSRVAGTELGDDGPRMAAKKEGVTHKWALEDVAPVRPNGIGGLFER